MNWIEETDSGRIRGLASFLHTVTIQYIMDVGLGPHIRECHYGKFVYKAV